MTEATPRNIISRRNRPAKAPLSREVIVATALQILERDGLSGLSLRRVASALDTGAASLYVYVANLEELHALMLDQALATIKLTGSSSRPWRDKLKAFLLAYLRVLYDRQGLAQIALSTIAAGPSSVRILEVLLGLLQEGGIDDAKAAWGVDLLTLHVTAIAAEQSLRREGDQSVERVKKVLSEVSEQQFPRVFAAKERLVSGDPNSRMEWALDVMVDGIAGDGRQPRPLKPRGSKRKR